MSNATPTPETTPVIFREWGNGDPIAIFPTEPGTNNPDTCSSYEHVGQHGSCDPQYLIACTKPAQDTAALRDLMRELTSIGYKLQPVKRATKAHRAAREAALRRY